MAQLNYLTVQDFLWLNLEITGAVQTFHYASLEDAAFYQYGYGDSRRLTDQAARLAWGFARKAPFAAGNSATGFIATVAFAELNGLACRLADGDAAADWAERMASGDQPAAGLFGEAFAEAGGHGHDDPDDVRHLVRHAAKAALARYPQTVAALQAREAGTPAALDVR